ncbi:Competence protein [Mesomycoplasma conjunctivae]|uniref:ComEC/Rec2-related protein domain-containing protein n=1 Tax=Mesomycoplasma conjunctivae (strain ATCC 25834 / NCTC 10147 / HRC/581) TaxID=572263 RepID=C5J5K2_MESCH|nr:ComEC/Rec2 family competence protein [Mesomycoplasma conjunctivae]CAT04725.1 HYPOTHETICAL PROTEIN MCJ_000480 [Mesomycoplasma conjunctivae]VEU65727.1 Competence protein [Mesomycoplasma conjunctivae]
MVKISTNIANWFSITKNSAKEFYSWILVLFAIISIILLLDYKNIWWLLGIFLPLIVLFSLSEVKKIIIWCFIAIIVILAYWVSIPDWNNKILSFDTIVKEETGFGSIVKFDNGNLLLEKMKIPANTKLRVSGQIIPINQIDNFEFDVVSFFKSKLTFFKIVKAKTEIVGQKNTIIDSIQKYLLEGGEYYKQLVPIIFLGQVSTHGQILRDNLILLGVYHIFVISGFHINILKQTIFWIGKKICLNKSIYSSLFFIFLIFQLFILNFPISFLRGVIFWILVEINKIFLNKKFKKHELLVFTAIAMILSNIFIIYSPAFILSFTITFIILLINNIKFKDKKIKTLISFFIINFVSALFTSYYNGSYNFLGPINFLIFSSFFTFFYFFLSLFIWSKPILDFASYLFIIVVENIVEIQFLILSYKINYLTLIFCNIITIICFLFMEMTTTSFKRRLEKSLA